MVISYEMIHISMITLTAAHTAQVLNYLDNFIFFWCFS